MSASLILQVTTETITFAVNGGDDFGGIWRGFKMFADTTDCHVNSTVVWLEIASGHFLQQISTRLNLAGIFAEVQHGTELTARQFVLLTVGIDE